MKVILIIPVLALTGCTMIERINEVATQVSTTLTTVNAAITTTKETIVSIKETVGVVRDTISKIDKDMDGKLSKEELWKWLLGGGGAGGMALYATAKGSAKKDDQLWDQLSALKADLAGRAAKQI